ncbi:hypothetical protein AVEN_37374-1 [Araneus ventricosus]|uniref:Uncharacterized protein n=1 Tax=Araneus ventricosus TaxID=182803 RepID=A0A4Y2MEK9_ARAVE|nr:hypothetical protein AVEN_37374-1 [Araneus ventricosus]
MKPLAHRVIRGSGGAGMTLDQFGCGDVLLNFAFPDFVIVEAIPGPLIHCEYLSSISEGWSDQLEILIGYRLCEILPSKTTVESPYNEVSLQRISPYTEIFNRNVK